MLLNSNVNFRPARIANILLKTKKRKIKNIIYIALEKEKKMRLEDKAYENCVFCEYSGGNNQNEIICKNKKCKYYKVIKNYIPFWKIMEDAGVIGKK